MPADLMRDRLGSETPAAVGANLDIAVEARDGHLRITPTGEVDLSTAAHLEQQILRALGKRRSPLVLDLSQLDFIDATGVHVLVACRDRASNTNVAFRVIAGHGQPRRILELCGLIDRLDSLPGGC
jgi:anti-sigma B factor antagonist